MRGPGKNRATGLLAVFIGATLLSMVVGCGTESYTRSAEMTHWHDEDTIVLVYTRQQTGGTFATIFRPEPKTLHIRVCKVGDDNTMECRHQREVTNMLNPHLVNEHELEDRWVPF